MPNEIDANILVCPETKLELRYETFEEAEQKIPGVGKMSPRRFGTDAKKWPQSKFVLLRDDAVCFFPIIDGVLILLRPEMVVRDKSLPMVDVRNPVYSEAYEEMDFYNKAAFDEAADIENSDGFQSICKALEYNQSESDSFPDPKENWIDALYDCAAQWDAFSYLAPMTGKRTMQIGGKGIQAVKFLIAGAGEAWVVTPMVGEIAYAKKLAKFAKVEDRLRCVIAIGEEMPFRDNCFDAIYSGGCLHHMTTDLALSECSRILKPGGRFAANDPWKAPLYTIGTKIFGKREDVHCKPLTKERSAPLEEYFDKHEIIHHGTFTRYPLIVLDKYGISSNLSTVWNLNYLDNSLCSLVPKMRSFGSSVALLGEV